MRPRIARELLTVFDTSNGNYKLAIQNLANAYRLICPSSKSADDFDQRIIKLRQQNNTEEEIFNDATWVIVECIERESWLDC